MQRFEPTAYGSGFAPFLDIDRNRPLDAGHPDPAAAERLTGLELAVAFAEYPLVDPQMGQACLAGLWLLYDFLDESHSISQAIESPTGSFWHGIMHRREGDFSNAKYWFRRVGRHNVYTGLLSVTQELAPRAEGGATRLAAMETWDPHAFVDLCASAVRGGETAIEPFLRSVQQAEWELLFDDCFARATGREPT